MKFHWTPYFSSSAMSLLLRSSRVLRRVASLNPSASYGSHAPAHADEWKPIGNREMVGYGINGSEHYADRPDFPCPAIRFKPITPDIQVEFLFFFSSVFSQK
jgi:hypothetical protein